MTDLPVGQWPSPRWAPNGDNMNQADLKEGAITAINVRSTLMTSPDPLLVPFEKVQIVVDSAYLGWDITNVLEFDTTFLLDAATHYLGDVTVNPSLSMGPYDPTVESSYRYAGSTTQRRLTSDVGVAVGTTGGTTTNVTINPAYFAPGEVITTRIVLSRSGNRVAFVKTVTAGDISYTYPQQNTTTLSTTSSGMLLLFVKIPPGSCVSRYELDGENRIEDVYDTVYSSTTEASLGFDRLSKLYGAASAAALPPRPAVFPNLESLENGAIISGGTHSHIPSYESYMLNNPNIKE